MPGPTTEVLNEDIKELKAEIRDIRDDLSTLKSDVHAMAVGLAEFRGEVRTALAVARWGGALLVTTILTLGGTSIWWARGVTADIKNLSDRFDRHESAKPLPAPHASVTSSAFIQSVLRP